MRGGKTMMEYNGKDERGKRREIQKEKDRAEKRSFVKSTSHVHGQGEPDL